MKRFFAYIILLCTLLCLLPLGAAADDTPSATDEPDTVEEETSSQDTSGDASQDSSQNASPWQELFGFAEDPESTKAPADEFFSLEEAFSQDDENGIWWYRSDSLAIFIRRHTTTVTSENNRTYPQVYFTAHIFMQNYNSFRTGFATEQENGVTLADAWRIARRERAVLAITGDNVIQQDTDLKGVIIRHGKVYLDNRRESFCAIKDDLTMEIFLRDEANAEELLERGIRETMSFGPWLIKDGVANDKVHQFRVNRVNPRVGVGQIAQGHFIAIVADGRQGNYSYGLTLTQFLELFVNAGCEQAYNMDGGCSTGMIFMGEHLNRHDGTTGAADYQRRWPDALMWGYSELVPTESDPLLHDGNQEG